MNQKSKVILGLKSPGEFSWEERELIVQEYLSSNCTKRAIWKKYTGQTQEHGNLLKWMRALGYAHEIPTIRRTFSHMSTEKGESEESTFENLQLKKRIEELEKELKDAKLKAIAYSTMVDLAEKEFKVPIRKKYNTKP